MMLFIALAQTPQDLDGVDDGWLTHHHRLETALKGRIALDVLAVLIKGGGPDALQLAAGQGRLENVCSVDGTFGRARTDQGVNFVDHENHVSSTADLLHDLFEPLLKFTAIFGTRHQQADVKGEHPLVFEDVGYFARNDPLSQPFGDGGLADAGLTDQHRIVLGAAAEDLDDPLDLVLPAHHGIKLALTSLLGEIATEFVEGGGLGGALATSPGSHFSGLAEHANHLGAHLREVNPEVLKHPCRHTFPFANQAEQQVLGSDVVVTELTGLLEGQLQHPLGPWGEGNLHRHETRAPADDFFHLYPGVLEVDPHRLEHLGGDASAFTDQTQQDLFGAHKVVTQASSLFLGQHDHLDGLLSKALEHGPWPGTSVPNLSGLKGMV